MVVPPLALSALEIFVATAAAAVVVIVLVMPLGNTTRPLPSFPLGSAQLMPLKPLVLVVDKANDFDVILGFVKAVPDGAVIVSFLAHDARPRTPVTSSKILKLFLTMFY
jgi:hypothetical protein